MTDQPVRIRIEIDKQAQQAVNASIDAMGARFVSIGDKLGKVSVQAQQTGVAFKQGFGSVTGEIENAGKALSKIQEGSASFYRGISGLTGGALGEIAQTSRQIEEVTRGFQKMTSQGIGPLLQALGPTVLAGAALSAGIAGVSALINAYNQGLETQKAQLKEEISLRQELRDLALKATTDEAQAKRDAAYQSVADIKVTIQDLKDAQATLGKGAGIIEWNQKIEANRQAIDEQQKLLEAATKKLDAYNKALNENTFAGGDAVKAIQDEMTKREKWAPMLKQSTAAVEAQLKTLQDDYAITFDAYVKMNDLVKEGNQAAIQPASELAQKLVGLRENIEVLKKAILPQVKAQEAAIEASKKATAAYEAQQKASEDAFQKVQQRNKDLATAQGKYEADVEAIQTASLQKRADIEQKYADTLVSIAEDATQKAQDRLDKLNQDRAEKTTALMRDEENATIQAGIAELDIRIKAQREERDALQDHLRTLENIRANAKQREQIDLLNRNFLGVLQSRLQMGGDIAGENQKYTQGQQDRTQDVQDQLSDLQRAQAQERAARLKAYQQQLADAQAAYQRETAQASKDRALAMARAQIDRNRALAEEERSRAQSIAILRKQHIQELQDIYDFGARKLKAERDLLQAALNMIAQVNAGAKPGVKGKPTQTVTQFADGGDIGAGEWGLVQEGRNREAFNGIPFPSAGAGMFYPMQGGTISHVSNTTTNTPMQNTFNIPGANSPNEIARVVVDILGKVQKR